MKSKPTKGSKRASRVKTEAQSQLGKNPSSEEVKDFILAKLQAATSEKATSENLMRMWGFSESEAKALIAGSKKARTKAIMEKVREREVKK
ncbi:MAG TPA: hypothetical protein VK714_01875 [Myxococcota bacterium]|nr:hypothetical protein [Myxococcota bacterium]